MAGLIVRSRNSKTFCKLLLFGFICILFLGFVVLKFNSEEVGSDLKYYHDNREGLGQKSALPEIKEEIEIVPLRTEASGDSTEQEAIATTVILAPETNALPQTKLVTQGGEDPDPEVNKKRQFIKRMMEDAWGEYVKYAWGANELMPNRRRGRSGGDIYGHTDIGATIIDSLGTLHIMGMNEEFKRGRDWISEHFDFSKVRSEVSLFETNIRILGGFLSAFALTNDSMFLDKAQDVAQRLLPAFETRSGIPRPRVSPHLGTSSGSEISLAELGSLHLEFVYLSMLTNNYTYYNKVYQIRTHMRRLAGNGAYRDSVGVYGGGFATSDTSIGGGADSFYEYLVKSWIQLGKKEDREMYDAAIQAMIDGGMMKISPENHLMYFGKMYAPGAIENSFSHLACFAGAMFALGSVSDPEGTNKVRDMEIAKNITNTCHESYVRARTKLGPESFSFYQNAEAMSTSGNAPYYILRPEVVESYFTLYRLTGDPKYRDWGWEAALAIEKYCKAKGDGESPGKGRGYSGITNVNNPRPGQDDVQQTFFLAETLKYLYLLFSSPDLIDLNSWVFNTEAHPLPIKGKNPMFSPRSNTLQD